MKLDRTAVERLLALDDEKFRRVIGRLASGAGIDVGGFAMSGSDIASLRRALSLATDSDIAKASELLGASRSAEEKRDGDVG